MESGYWCLHFSRDRNAKTPVSVECDRSESGGPAAQAAYIQSNPPVLDPSGREGWSNEIQWPKFNREMIASPFANAVIPRFLEQPQPINSIFYTELIDRMARQPRTLGNV